ncbi:beta-galactosidase [Dyadobacter aurulentus]|uniref:beta-galactosidase n=1 Tax=Dyadobacter sp. UC 10 TaxID=2605428 RepID=UPI0011F39C01|nr:beta-galactosidase [Dyadobacter sp. UC 10]KAA0992869.1 T9SS type A sorting domain-containing protein [Dyadobacter sp. UC 10]
MKKPILFNRSIFRISCILSLCFCAFTLSAQQRYFAVSLVNENDKPALDVIDDAKSVGCNAIAMTVQWGAIHGKVSRILKQENGSGYNVWKQYDDQIKRALSLNMKVALNIAVSTGDDVTNSSSDRYGITTGDGWKKEERMVVANYNGEEAVFQKWGGPIRPNISLQFVMTSLAAQSTKDRITSFSREVMERYKYLQQGGNLLYVNLVYTRQGEGEFEMGSTKYHYEEALDMANALTDYSQPMVAAYRVWLKGKYGNIEALNSVWGRSYSSFNDVNPKKPSNSTFTQPDGTDWFLFRTHTLKETNRIFKEAVKGVNPNVKVISHHGSVYDKLSRARGTLPFKEIGEDLDGIKVNDDIHYDHRFAMDLLRSNLPGRIYVNEAAYVTGVESVVRLAEESYTHGAQVVTLFYLENAMKSQEAVNAIKTLTNNWVKGKSVTKPAPSNSDSFALSNMINSDGCYTNRDSWSGDCDAYKNWRSAYDNSGGKPVNIYVNDDVTTRGCFYKDLKLSRNGEEAESVIPNNVDYHLTGDDCRVISTVKGSGLSDGNRPFKALVTIEDQVRSRDGQPYIQRHWKFTPGSNGASATVTLYVSQAEFNAFNAVSSQKLPLNANDATNKSKLRIWQREEGANLRTAESTIDPADQDIRWDSVLGLWKITFNATSLSSYFITADKAAPLPVSLTTFTAEKQENSVELSWQTSEESNSDHFAVQRSMDGKSWLNIGRVNAAMESRVHQNYSFNDANPASGDNLYRLKMVDQDSTFAYSKIISVKMDGGAELVLYPNPVTTGVIRLQFAGQEPLISLTDLSGREVRVATEKDAPNSLAVKAGTKLNPGLYILTATYGSRQVRHKVLVAAQ